jgi:misacylated tRNA(Ala) deacylase
MEQEPFHLETVSWNLGEKKSYIELQKNEDVKITPELLSRVELAVNNLIVKNIPVIVHAQEAQEDITRPDSLPADYVGGGHIRTIEIENLDKNPCCGTHVTNLGQLQALKLLHTENVRGGNTRLFFLFGKRVLDTLDSLNTISRQLNTLLSCPPEGFVENVEKIQKQSKEHSKRAKKLLESLAVYTVNDVEVELKEKSFALVYKEEADMEFLAMVANVIRDRKLLEEGTQKVVVLAAGEKQTGGPIIVTGGTNEIVQRAGKIVTTTLSGVKGGGKGRWQGKAQNWSGIENLEKALADELAS